MSNDRLPDAPSNPDAPPSSAGLAIGVVLIVLVLLGAYALGAGIWGGP